MRTAGSLNQHLRPPHETKFLGKVDVDATARRARIDQSIYLLEVDRGSDDERAGYADLDPALIANDRPFQREGMRI